MLLADSWFFDRLLDPLGLFGVAAQSVFMMRKLFRRHRGFAV